MIFSLLFLAVLSSSLFVGAQGWIRIDCTWTSGSHFYIVEQLWTVIGVFVQASLHVIVFFIMSECLVLQDILLRKLIFFVVGFLLISGWICAVSMLWDQS